MPMQNKVRLLIGLAAVLLLLCGTLLYGNPLQKRKALPDAAMQISGTPTIGPLTVEPNLIAVNTPTEVTFTVSIPDPTLNPASVNLLRLSANGSSAIVAEMTDTGQNGDQQSGDKVFTARFTLNQAQVGELGFQVSAAFRGLVRRVLSPSVAVSVGARIEVPSTGVSFIVPPSLQPTPFRGDAEIAGMSLLFQASSDQRYGGDINVIVWGNPLELSTTDYFDGSPGPNLFGQAADGLQLITIDARIAYVFRKVAGYVTSDYYVIPLVGKFLAFDVSAETGIIEDILPTITLP